MGRKKVCFAYLATGLIVGLPGLHEGVVQVEEDRSRRYARQKGLPPLLAERYCHRRPRDSRVRYGDRSLFGIPYIFETRDNYLLPTVARESPESRSPQVPAILLFGKLRFDPMLRTFQRSRDTLECSTTIEISRSRN